MKKKSKITTEQIKSLREHFRAIGWSDADIMPALDKIAKNPKKQTIVMPKHYEEEAKLHAKSTCEVLGLNKGSESYSRTYEKAYNQYLTDAYMNSTGIDTEGLMQQNPTTPRSVAAFNAAIYASKSPYKQIIEKLERSPLANDVYSAEKFRRTLKSGAMTVAHLYLKYVGGYTTKQASFPDMSFTSPATSFQFLEKTGNMSLEEREEMVREVGQKNLMRGLILSAVLKVLEPIFRMDFNKINKLVETKLKMLPASVYTDQGWLTRFNTELEFFIAKRIKDLDMSEIINDTFVHAILTYRPSLNDDVISQAIEGAQTATPAKITVALDKLKEQQGKGPLSYINKENVPTPNEEKQIATQAKEAEVATKKASKRKKVIPDEGTLFDPTYQRKNPTKTVGLKKRVKKSKALAKKRRQLD